jgi:hypothetical protein
MIQSTNFTVERFVALLKLAAMGAVLGLGANLAFLHGSSYLSSWLKAGGLGALLAVLMTFLYALVRLLRNALVARWNRFATRKYSSEDLFVAALMDEKLSKAEAETLLRMSLDKHRKDDPQSSKPR